MFMPNKDRILSASEAILEATDQMMKKDNNLILIGEGINDPKGIFGTTINLSKKYGEKRAIESPISENGITGIAIGLGINNFKVLLVHQRVEFALLSIEQIFNTPSHHRMHHRPPGNCNYGMEETFWVLTYYLYL